MHPPQIIPQSPAQGQHCDPRIHQCECPYGSWIEGRVALGVLGVGGIFGQVGVVMGEEGGGVEEGQGEAADQEGDVQPGDPGALRGEEGGKFS